MTVTTSSLHITSNGSAAGPVRRFYEAAFDGRQGIAAAGDLLVSEKSGTPNMSVDVAVGSCLITGTESATQGAYWLENLAVLNVVISASDATNPRKDLIVAKVQDSDFSGATDAGSIVVVTGTPAGSPAEPTVPDNAVVLAMVDVAALASSVVDANVTDRRTSTTGQDRLAAMGGVTVAASTAQLPTSPTEGLMAWQSDTAQMKVYTSAAWEILATTTATSYVPADLIQALSAVAAIKNGRYVRTSNTVTGTLKYTVTATGSSGVIQVGLPFTPAAGYAAPLGQFYFQDVSGGAVHAGQLFADAGTTAHGFDQATQSNVVTAVASPDLVICSFHYEI